MTQFSVRECTQRGSARRSPYGTKKEKAGGGGMPAEKEEGG